jgi:alanine racemase
MIRIGGILYGLGDDVLPAGIAKPDLRPVMTVSSEISLLKTVAPGTTLGYGRSYLTRRESLIASVPIGYNDGVPRALSNIGEVVVRGHRAPIVGRVSMDWILVDVTDIPDVGMRDRVSFIGPDDPNGITAAEIAQKVGTISYEITCGISHRVPRLFFDAEDGVMN